MICESRLQLQHRLLLCLLFEFFNLYGGQLRQLFQRAYAKRPQKLFCCAE